MSSIIHTQDIVRNYNVDELSFFQKCAIDSKEKQMMNKITKIFLALNGASGCNVRNIPHNMAGFFSCYVDMKIYQRMMILKQRIDSYQRFTDSTQRMFNNILNEFNEIKEHWNHVVTQKRGEIPQDVSFEVALNHLQELDIVSSPNYGDYDGYSWIQWYEYLQSQFNILIENCKEKSESYQQNWKQWFVSIFNPVSWAYFVYNGFTTYSKTAIEYTNFKDGSVIPKRNIIFSRLDDVITASQAFNDLEELIVLEETTISDPKNCQKTQQVLENTLVFKSECNRLFSIIRNKIGFISRQRVIE